MKWAEKIYLSPKYEAQRAQLKPMIRSMDFPPLARIFILTKTDEEKPRLTIVSAAEVKSRREEFRTDCLAVGVAGNRKEALELAQRMTDDALRETGEADAAAYLAEKLWRQTDKEDECWH
ncbi:MAG: hypothetical protein ACOX78_00620 [Lachnospiraceae bacterium]|jgi:hypothetical protein